MNFMNKYNEKMAKYTELAIEVQSLGNKKCSHHTSDHLNHSTCLQWISQTTP